MPPRFLARVRGPHLDSPGGHGARASLDRAADADPLATRDSYADLSASHEAHFRRAGRSSGGSLDAKIERLATPLEQTLTVEVKLVGFDGDARAAPGSPNATSRPSSRPCDRT